MFLLSSKRERRKMSEVESFNPFNVFFATFFSTKNSELAVLSVSILRSVKQIWLHNCDVLNRVEDNKPHARQAKKRVGENV